MALTTAQIQQAYVTFFSRPADPVGLAYWQAYTGSVADLYATFAQQTEYSAAFSGLTSAQKVNVVYQNLFGRDAEASGLLYWAGQVEAGNISVANLALAVSAGSQGTDKVTVDSRVTAATAFTAALDTNAEILGYTGATANAAAKTWLAGVTTAANLATAVAAVDTAAAAVVAVGGAAGSTFTLTHYWFGYLRQPASRCYKVNCDNWQRHIYRDSGYCRSYIRNRRRYRWWYRYRLFDIE
ncbi:MAG: hypothetical protein B7Y59_11215 [Burkholderiales bacterium 35-55-47]|nr:MAG: hypothetical protein B7Y59_11215 [Burkholderiales bacterium 35-55-47]